MLLIVMGAMDSILALLIAAICIAENKKLEYKFKVWMGEIEPTVTKISRTKAWSSWLKEKYFDWLERRAEAKKIKNSAWTGARHALRY